MHDAFESVNLKLASTDCITFISVFRSQYPKAALFLLLHHSVSVKPGNGIVATASAYFIYCATM